MRTTAALVCLAASVSCSSGPDLPPCPATDAILTQSPLADADFVTLTPLGNLNPPGHVFPTEHQYFYLPPDGWLPKSVDVVAPGALTLTEVASSEHVNAGIIDYDLTLAACDGVSFRFGHVATLDAALAARIGGATGGDCQTYSTGGETYRRCTRSVEAPLQPGDRIGTAGGNPGQGALDMGAQDERKPRAAYANPSGWEQYLYSRCFIDYYGDATLRDHLLDRIGRTQEPRCGTHVQDLAGTAQGNWRKAGAGTFPEDPHIALVHDMMDPTRIALSLGTSLGSPGVWMPPTATTGHANRDPSVVVPSETWCWDATFGSTRLIVRMPTATTLQAEVQYGSCGTGPWALGPGAVAFAR